jgi:hypothetical protein
MALFDELAPRYMADLIRDFELEDFQAAGIVGNGGTESGGFEKLQEISPTAGRGGLGHFQWTGPRRVAFEQWIARNASKGYGPGVYEANYSMLYRELVGPEKASVEAVKQTTTLDEATRTFCEKFERPGVINMESRLRWATRAMTAFEAAGMDAASLKAQAHQQVIPPLSQMPPPGGDFAQILNAALPLLLQFLSNRQAPPAEPAPATAAASTPSPAKSSALGVNIATGVLGVLASLTASKYGLVGAPVGPTSTATGFLLPVAIAAASAVGIPAPIVSAAGGLLDFFVKRRMAQK